MDPREHNSLCFNAVRLNDKGTPRVASGQQIPQTRIDPRSDQLRFVLGTRSLLVAFAHTGVFIQSRLHGAAHRWIKIRGTNSLPIARATQLVTNLELGARDCELNSFRG